MSELQSEYAPNSLFAPMDDLETYIRGTWDLRHTHDFFTPPLPFQEEYRFSDPWLIFALFSLAKTTSLDTARRALREVLTRDEHEGEVTARDVQEARDYVIKEMEPEDLQRYNNVTVPGLRRDEVRWNRYKHQYEEDYHDLLRRFGRQGDEWGTRSMSRGGSRDDRRRSRLRSPVGRSQSRYRPRSRSRSLPRDRERRSPSVHRRSSPPPHPSLQRSRPVEQPAYFGSATNHSSEYAIETPNLVTDPPGATYDEKLRLRDEVVQMLGAQEEYYEAVRRKMLSRYMARVQKYEKKVIQIGKRVAGEERTRYSRDDEGRGRGDRGRDRENRDSRRR